MEIEIPKPKVWPVPDTGDANAVCIDVIELGDETVDYGKGPVTRKKMRLLFQVEQCDEEGKPMRVGKKYTQSVHEKSKLRIDLKSWRGADLTAEELAAGTFNIDKVIGAQARLLIVHVPKNDGTKDVWANISVVMPPTDGVKVEADPDYERQVNR